MFGITSLISANSDNIDSALGGYFKRENLGQGENMYKCEKCKQKVNISSYFIIHETNTHDHSGSSN